MAIKDQCLQCHLFNVSSGLHRTTGHTPMPNHTSCEMYQKSGQILLNDHVCEADGTNNLKTVGSLFKQNQIKC